MDVNHRVHGYNDLLYATGKNPGPFQRMMIEKRRKSTGDWTSILSYLQDQGLMIWCRSTIPLLIPVEIAGVVDRSDTVSWFKHRQRRIAILLHHKSKVFINVSPHYLINLIGLILD